jgi:O-antigen/teichoic acid export membrane protein
LLPKDFGIIGMITIFIAVSQSIVDSGFGNALIREKNTTQEDYSTVFFFNLLTSVVLYFILFFSSPVIANFFLEPKLILIIKVLGLILIINSFGLIQKTILTKKIDFKTQTKVVLISSVISGVVAIVFAYLGFGVWSLIFRNLIMQFLQSLMFSIYNKWTPSFIFSWDSFKRLFGFGWKLLVSGLINTLYNNIYLLIIGKVFSAVDLGYYTNAKRLSEIASSSVTTAVQKVTYPVLSTLKDDNELLSKDFFETFNFMYISMEQSCLVLLNSTLEEPIILVFK